MNTTYSLELQVDSHWARVEAFDTPEAAEQARGDLAARRQTTPIRVRIIQPRQVLTPDTCSHDKD